MISIFINRTGKKKKILGIVGLLSDSTEILETIEFLVCAGSVSILAFNAEEYP